MNITIVLSYGERVRWERYNHIEESLCYWRTSSGYEVDTIIGEGRIAIEIKSTDEVKSRHSHGLKTSITKLHHSSPFCQAFDSKIF